MPRNALPWLTPRLPAQPPTYYSGPSKEEVNKIYEDWRQEQMLMEEARRQWLAQQEAQEAMRLADWDGQERRRRNEEQASTAPVGPWRSIGTQALPGLTPEWVPRAPPPRQWVEPPPGLWRDKPYLWPQPSPPSIPSPPGPWTGSPPPRVPSPWEDAPKEPGPPVGAWPGPSPWRRSRPTQRNSLLAR